VNLNYVKELTNVDSEVFYDTTPEYERKPYLGILLNANGNEYLAPLTSPKKKHKRWSNVTRTNYLVYEMIDISETKIDDIFVQITGTTIVKKILAVLEIKKMIPVKIGLYSKIDFSAVTDSSYKDLLQKEYKFCKNIINGIVDRANDVYKEQISTGIVKEFHCNYLLLESICKVYL
jgi:protein AbiQ